MTAVRFTAQRIGGVPVFGPVAGGESRTLGNGALFVPQRALGQALFGPIYGEGAIRQDLAAGRVQGKRTRRRWPYLGPKDEPQAPAAAEPGIAPLAAPAPAPATAAPAAAAPQPVRILEVLPAAPAKARAPLPFVEVVAADLPDVSEKLAQAELAAERAVHQAVERRRASVARANQAAIEAATRLLLSD